MGFPILARFATRALPIVRKTALKTLPVARNVALTTLPVVSKGYVISKTFESVTETTQEYIPYIAGGAIIFIGLFFLIK